MAKIRYKTGAKGVRAAKKAANKAIKQAAKVPNMVITGVEVVIKTARKPFKKRRR